MKPSRSLFSWLSLIAFLTLAVGCAGTKQSENQLALAGFKPIAASTAKQQEQIKALPPGKLTRIQHNGKPYYVFPDAARNQVYVGSPKQYQDYQQIHSDLQLSNQNQGQMGEDIAADTYNLEGWEESVWGN